ncbi:MAG: hypothetical protein RLY16_2701 [Bacteroidota bacterium]|jgi:cell division protein FtsB
MKFFQKIPSWLTNKFLLAGIFFLVWMVFFAEKDVQFVMGRQAKLRELEKSEKHLQEKISQAKLEQSQLRTDAQTIEKYARENYGMKKDNEDLFLLAAPPANAK